MARAVLLALTLVVAGCTAAPPPEPAPLCPPLARYTERQQTQMFLELTRLGASSFLMRSFIPDALGVRDWVRANCDPNAGYLDEKAGYRFIVVPKQTDT